MSQRACGQGLEGITRPADAEGILGTVASSPGTLLRGRHDTEGRLHTGRSTALSRAAGATVAGLLAAGLRGHPWTGGRSALRVDGGVVFM
jgi:hypothetical protein